VAIHGIGLHYLRGVFDVVGRHRPHGALHFSRKGLMVAIIVLGFYVLHGLEIWLYAVVYLLIVGGIMGYLARFLVPGQDAMTWWQTVLLGIVVPLALQGLELGHRIPHTVLPALFVLVGGFTLRWVMVRAGQLSHIVQATAN
jgi:uncharacterized membrane protein YeaQ/YmgE (transglycosylase-associated protein family)